jgi:RecB family exonuclease
MKSNWGAEHGSLLHDILENYVNGNDQDWMSRLYRGYAGSLETLDRYGNPTVMGSPLEWAKDKDFANKTPRCDYCPYVEVDEGVCGISREPLNNLTGCPKDLFDGSVSMLEDTIRRYEYTWEKLLRDEKGSPIGAEYAFKIKIPGTDVPIIGVMDLVIKEDEETIHVIDYKTGSWTQNYHECREDIQVKMYSLASRREFIDDINKKGYNFKNVILTFDYFTKYPITLAFTEEEDLETENYVKNKIEEIQQTEWIRRIVKSNEDFEQRSAWKCRSLCDPDVCKSKWKGAIRVGENS